MTSYKNILSRGSVELSDFSVTVGYTILRACSMRYRAII